MSAAKTSALLALIFGLLNAILSALTLAISGKFQTLGIPGLLLLVTTTPILYAIGGFIAGALFAVSYNVVSRFTGGLEIEQ